VWKAFPDQHPLWPAFAEWAVDHAHLPADLVERQTPHVLGWWSCFLAGAAAAAQVKEADR